MRKLTICGTDTDTILEIEDNLALELIKDGLLYECGDETDHDLHLTPDHKWNHVDVERILLAVQGA